MTRVALSAGHFIEKLLVGGIENSEPTQAENELEKS
jgi:hypothetical protein